MTYQSPSRSWSLAEMPEVTGLNIRRTLTNLDMEEPDWSVQMDPTWPECVLNDEEPTMKFTIENGIEIPKKYRPHRHGLYADIMDGLTALEIGQSFLIPFEGYPGHTISNIQNSVSAAKIKMKSTGKFFITRKRLDEKVPGIRIWRLE